MMQGILHYTSSAYHIAHLEVLKEALEMMGDLSVRYIVDFEVSSDDEGILITIMSDTLEKLKEHCRDFRERFMLTKQAVDYQFGVRHS